MAHSGYYTDLASYENVNQLVETAEAYSISASESADQAAISATDAASSATDSASQSANASSFADASADSATSSAGSASAAAASASSAAISDTSASDSASAAASSASSAAASASSASSSASAAATSASNAASTLAASMLKANNLSDVANVNTARTNLGVNNQTGPYATATGTVNAIVLTTNYAPAKQTALVAGHQVRTRIAASNTGATTMALDGLTAKTCVTVTGVDLPPGYIRTTVDTEFTYDSVADKWVVDRVAQYGSNANGEFWKYADGRLDCISPALTVAVTTASGQIFTSSGGASWTFPATYSAAPFVTSIPNSNSYTWGSGNPSSTTTTAQLKVLSAASLASTGVVGYSVGRWY